MDRSLPTGQAAGNLTPLSPMIHANTGNLETWARHDFCIVALGSWETSVMWKHNLRAEGCMALVASIDTIIGGSLRFEVSVSDFWSQESGKGTDVHWRGGLELLSGMSTSERPSTFCI